MYVSFGSNDVRLHKLNCSSFTFCNIVFMSSATSGGAIVSLAKCTSSSCSFIKGLIIDSIAFVTSCTAFSSASIRVLSKFFLSLNDNVIFHKNFAFVKTFRREVNFNKLTLNYLVTSVTFAMTSHCLVIALLSVCPINQWWTAPLFSVIPTIPPFIFESLKKLSHMNTNAACILTYYTYEIF